MICVGGVRRQWHSGQVALLRKRIQEIEAEFRSLVDLIHSSDSTRDRLETTGYLSPDKARDLAGHQA
jgi:Ni,Fe-hydrogenase III large subunit